MAKTLEFDLGADRLIGIAADLVDSHNYIGALKMLNKNAEADGNDEDSYMLYAEIFDDMGLYERCVNGWFRFMDNTAECDWTDCYEGLAVSFMNLGNQRISRRGRKPLEIRLSAEACGLLANLCGRYRIYESGRVRPRRRRV